MLSKQNKQKKAEILKYALVILLISLILRVIIYLFDANAGISFHSFSDFSIFLFGSIGLAYIIWYAARYFKNDK